ncbi:MAG TPA: pyridoxamine 5'-phosphate oxidase family protein [Actinomycetota bacterium]
MTSEIPVSARECLDSAVLCYLSVPTSKGPHLTPVVFVFDGGRLWLTTSRRSLKARAWKRNRRVAGLIEGGDRAVTFRGSVRLYDALDPFSWPSAALGAPRLMRAAARFTSKNARFFAGYAVDASRVPFAWSPPGRVFAAIEMDGGRVLDQSAGAVVDEWGNWPADLEYAPSYPARQRGRAARLALPSDVRDAVSKARTGAIALEGPLTTVLPVRVAGALDRSGSEATLPRAFADLAFADAECRAAITVGHASTWRAAEMTGMLLQGRGTVYAMNSVKEGKDELRRRLRTTAGSVASSSELALVTLEPSRAVWWSGWTAGTVEAGTGKARRP